MKATVKIEKEVELKSLSVTANVRYWEDATINGVDDEEGTLTPCKKGECWCPEIDIETGKINNWVDGVVASIHFKVCDEGVYSLRDDQDNIVYEREGYVPKCMSPKEPGYGDYIIMNINHEGFIEDWKFDPDDFIETDN